MPAENENAEGAKLVLDEWKTVISTQMHFNEMIMRMRTTGVSVVIGVYGAAAFALGQYPAKFLSIGGMNIHVSAVIIAFGILLLASIFVLDYCYYFRLLIGAVRRATEIDAAYDGRLVLGARLFGMTTRITGEVSRRRAEISLRFFYGAPLVAGMVSLIYLLGFYDP